MFRILTMSLCMLLLSAALGLAADAAMDESVVSPPSASASNQSETREMSGMSIVGNDEAPKSLYIVPWKSSDVGVQTSLDPMLTEDDVPVDRDVFRRRIEFYKLTARQ